MAPLAKLMWFREQEPDRSRAVARWGGRQGLRPPAARAATWSTDHSSRVGHGPDGTRRPRLGRRGARPRGRRRRPAPAARAPDRPASRSPADAAARTGLTPGSPVVAGGGDGPLANLGARRGPPRRRGVLDRDERRAAAHRRAPRGRPAAAGLLLRADRPGAGSSAARSTTAASCCSGPGRARAGPRRRRRGERCSSPRPRRRRGAPG